MIKKLILQFQGSVELTQKVKENGREQELTNALFLAPNQVCTHQ